MSDNIGNCLASIGDRTYCYGLERQELAASRAAASQAAASESASTSVDTSKPVTYYTDALYDWASEGLRNLLNGDLKAKPQSSNTALVASSKPVLIGRAAYKD